MGERAIFQYASLRISSGHSLDLCSVGAWKFQREEARQQYDGICQRCFIRMSLPSKPTALHITQSSRFSFE
ncbi:hypothetical protein L204_105092 [Cryptococcus depauperatus]